MNHVPLGEVNAEEWIGGTLEDESCHGRKPTDFSQFFGGLVGFLPPRLVKGRSTPKTPKSIRNICHKNATSYRSDLLISGLRRSRQQPSEQRFRSLQGQRFFERRNLC